MANLRQSILIRTDLHFPVGLLTAQVAHLHALPLIEAISHVEPSPESLAGRHLQDLLEWKNSPYVFVHKVPNLEVLEYFESLLDDSNLNFGVWKDTVYVNISETQTKAFSGVMIGLSIGPHDSDAIKTIIGDLPLL